jgi:hypothetical protein
MHTNSHLLRYQMNKAPLFNNAFFRGIPFILCCFFAAACADDKIGRAIAQIEITALPDAALAQVEVSDPVGIDVGTIALYGLGTATFAVQNTGRGILHITSIEVEEKSGGNFTIVQGLEELGVTETGQIVIGFQPVEDERPENATILLKTNAGISENDEVRIQIKGIGDDLGQPALQVCYKGQCYPQADECDATSGECTFPALDFGHVAFSSVSTEAITIKNNGNCQRSESMTACSPVCMLTFAKNPEAYYLGLGFVESDEDFSIAGNLSTPVSLVPADSACGESGELKVLVNFKAAEEENEVANTFVIESDLTGSTAIKIPLAARSSPGPVAVAKLQACDEEHPYPNCSGIDTVNPLKRVYFDGSESFQEVPSNWAEGEEAPSIASYSWSVVEAPEGVEISDYTLQGASSASFSMIVPLAGDYLIRLRVTNSIGTPSPITGSSADVVDPEKPTDIWVHAVPEAGIHIALTWDDPENDQDLHFTLATTSATDRICDKTYDCYWANCNINAKSCCEDVYEELTCEAFSETYDGFYGDPISCADWIDDSTSLFEGANPRLDIDDQSGLGPENVNVDVPQEGAYHIYSHHYFGGGAWDPDSKTVNRVRVYLNGELRGDFQRQVQTYDLWWVGVVTVDGEGNVGVEAAPSDEEGQFGQIKTMYGCSADPTTGEYPTFSELN